ncbi:MAG: ribonuclease Z [Desulfovibrionales bacterium]
MSLRQLHILGTSSQVPTKERNHHGCFLQWDDEGVLMDPGEGTQRQMTLFGIPASRVTKILITHFHGDHCLGLAGVIQRLALDGATHMVRVFFPASGRDYFERMRKVSIFHGPVHLEPIPIEGAGTVHKGNNLEIIALPLDHSAEVFGYRLQEPDRRTMIPEVLDRFGITGIEAGELSRKGGLEKDGRTVRLEEVSRPRPGQSAALVMDTRPCLAALDLAKNVDLLIAEATYLSQDSDLAASYGHMTAAGSAKMAAEAGAKLLVLTHFSPRYTDLEPFETEAGAQFQNVIIARDGDRIPVPKRTRDLRKQ